MSETNEAANKGWKSTCRVLFGKELGELPEFGKYLSEAMFPFHIAKSSISGKTVMVNANKFSGDAKFVSQDEAGKISAQPFSINDIKDIDSLIGAARERAYFCGNKMFGVNLGVSMADNCTDCSNAHYCHNIFNTKNAAYCSYLRQAEGAFGVSGVPNARFCVRCVNGMNVVRGFETFYGSDLSDAYYTFNCSGCSECMFCFNQRNRKYEIGNNALPKEKYAPLKAKLLSELADVLAEKKRAVSMAELASMGMPRHSKEGDIEVPDLPAPSQIEEAFRKTTNLVLGREINGISSCRGWLLTDPGMMRKVKGRGGRTTYKVAFPINKGIPAEKMDTAEKALESGSAAIKIGENELPPLDEIISRASKIAVFTNEYQYGRADGCVDTPSVLNSANIYHCWDGTNSRLCGYGCCGMADCEYVFGGQTWLVGCRFCLNIYDSTTLTMCLETDSSHESSKCHFCHNVENCEECIFCFNAKGLRYAVCNTEVGKAEYLRIKKMLLDFVNSNIGKSGKAGISLFALGKAEK